VGYVHPSWLIPEMRSEDFANSPIIGLKKLSGRFNVGKKRVKHGTFALKKPQLTTEKLNSMKSKRRPENLAEHPDLPTRESVNSDT
jgi:hypothetical protein